MSKTALEILRYTRTEAWVEDLLFAHPELLAPGLPVPQRQYILRPTSYRVDLLFEDETQTTLVEIKKGTVDLATLEQVRRYRGLLQKPGRRFRAYVVGAGISAEAAKSLGRTGGRLQYRQIGRDIPREVVLCRPCRMARDYRLSSCPYCGGRENLV
ncbi:Protein of unknown function DUF91 [Prosthecobacter debontii]|uniref:Endonuclease NucS C-terminal domain-containing protein n=1 Tax=Prosthecobacter debontii TaxID=48467 RepID=A0A1T4XQI7_9BACT|nr:endonuclease NucS domain-containing protein [Prosthecobacter debontii]SKA91800.1 Protein of unknown function DUF91 [Prosthecobacter debontii]